MATAIDSLYELLPQGTNIQIGIHYSKKFRPYNARARKTAGRLEFSLSHEWKPVSDEIKLGLLQSLAAKIIKLEIKQTTNIDLYNNFIRSLHLSSPKTHTDPELEEAFSRVNEKYFNGLIEKPNFAWHSSTRRLASYDYHTDTISASDVFKGRANIIDYLMYHEILHKKLKYTDSRKTDSTKTTHHSPVFKKMEKSYENAEALEKEIRGIIRKYKSTG